MVVVALAACGRLHFDERAPRDGSAIGSGDAPDDAPPPACGAKLGAGRSHFCAKKGDGSVWCWGLGTLGQLGDGLLATHPVPTQVPLSGPAVDVHGGRDETCAALADGYAWCWGENGFGQLGDNSTTMAPTPQRITSPVGFDEVWPAAQHTCGRVDGSIWCWGDGSSGRTGDGMNTTSLVPIQIPTISTAVAMSAGGSHSCAILGDGTLECWGYNNDGQIGNNTQTDVMAPTVPIGLGAAKGVAMRDLSTCAIRQSDGAVYCWGRNDFAQCGIGTTTPAVLVPTPTVTMSGNLVGADEIANGIQHACARLGTDVWCWGDNSQDQLGGETAMATSAFALRMTKLPPIVRLAASGETTCALDTQGVVHCWGLGNSGELGDGTMTVRQPNPVLALDACM